MNERKEYVIESKFLSDEKLCQSGERQAKSDIAKKLSRGEINEGQAIKMNRELQKGLTTGVIEDREVAEIIILGQLLSPPFDSYMMKEDPETLAKVEKELDGIFGPKQEKSKTI